MKIKKICKRAIQCWGILQFDMVIEECAELIHAVSKYKRKDGFGDEVLIDSVCEEVVDVKLMIAQMECLYPERIKKWEMIKLARLERKLDEEAKEKMRRIMAKEKT